MSVISLHLVNDQEKEVLAAEAQSKDKEMTNKGGKEDRVIYLTHYLSGI